MNVKSIGIYASSVVWEKRRTLPHWSHHHIIITIFSGSRNKMPLDTASDSVIFEIGFSFYSETLHYWLYHPVSESSLFFDQTDPQYTAQHLTHLYSPLRIVVCECVQFKCTTRKCTFEIKQLIRYIRHFNLIVILSIGLRKRILLPRFCIYAALYQITTTVISYNNSPATIELD